MRLLIILIVILSHNVTAATTKTPTPAPTMSAQDIKSQLDVMKESLTGELGTGLAALKGIVTRIQNIADSASTIADYTQDVADVVDDIKDVAPTVLDNVESFFSKNWLSWPTSSTDDESAYKLLEAFEALFEAVEIPFPDLDIGFFFQLIDIAVIETEWINYVNAAAVSIQKIIVSVGGVRRRLEEHPINERRLASTETCVLTATDFTICSMSEAVYTEGIWYEYVVLTPLKLDLSTAISQYVDIGNSESGSIATDTKTYTDGNLLAFFKLLHHILTVFVAEADNLCEAAVDCADPLITDAIVSPVCNHFVKVLKYVNSWFGYILDNADYHDDLVTATQLQALFDDRIIMVRNQMKIKNFVQVECNETRNLTTTQMDTFTMNMINGFRETRELLENEINTLTKTMEDEFNLTDALIQLKIAQFREAMNGRFDETRQIIQNRFDTLTSYLNGTFTDMFSRLTEIDKLIRTPNGDRDGWNEQTFESDADAVAPMPVYVINKSNYYIGAFGVAFVYLMLSIILVMDQIILCCNRKNVVKTQMYHHSSN